MLHMNFGKITSASAAAIFILMGLFGQTNLYKKWAIKMARKWAPYEIKKEKQLKLVNLQAWISLIAGIIFLLLTIGL